MTLPWNHAPILRFAALAAVLFVQRSAAQTEPSAKYPDFPSETPAELKPVTDAFEYDRRDAMIPMRDGIRLHTVIVVPKGAHGAPILLTRTPYNAAAQISYAESTHLGPILQGYDNAN